MEIRDGIINRDIVRGEFAPVRGVFLFATRTESSDDVNQKQPQLFMHMNGFFVVQIAILIYLFFCKV